MKCPRLKRQLIRAVVALLGLFCVTSAAWTQDRVPLSIPDHSAVLAIEPSFFDPGGYYFPTPTLIVSGYKIESIRIDTLEYYYDNDIHYDKPRFHPPEIQLKLTHVVDQAQSHYDCSQTIISRDQLSFVCQASPIGVLSFSGKFVDKRGQFWKRKDVIALETIVVAGEITISQGVNNSKPRQVSFTYWQGD
jgi:hypothetical protein